MANHDIDFSAHVETSSLVGEFGTASVGPLDEFVVPQGVKQERKSVGHLP